MSEDTSKTEDDGNDLTYHRGRSRFCKQCKFQCTDPKEFLDHQKFAHSQDTDPDLIRSLGGRRRKSQPIKRVESRSNSVTDLNIEQNISPKMEQFKGSMNNSNNQEPKDVKIMTNEMKHEFRNMTENMDNSIDGPIGDIEDLAHMNGDGDFDRYSNLSHEMEDDEGRLIIAEEDQIPGSIKTPTRSGNIQNRTYVCGQCDFSSTSAKTFLHHQKDAHSVDITIYECDICEYATKYKQKLPRHRKLHFSGKDSILLMNGSDLDSSFSEKDNKSTAGSDIIKLNVPMHDDDDEEDGEEEEEEEEPPVLMVIPEAPPGEKKKRKTRQEVDPGKYFEVFDEAGIKYACSKCGNVYKWRKSLNKHWKEKHFGDIPDSSKPPPGLAKLNAISNMKYRYPVPPSERGRLAAMNHSTVHSGSSTPVMHEKMDEISLAPVVMPRSIGPFISNAPTFYPQPKMAHNSRTSSDKGYSPQQNRSMNTQDRLVERDEQPIDFSVHKDVDMNLRKQIDFNRNRLLYEHPMEKELYKKYPELKQEPRWGGSPNAEEINKDREENPVLQCSRCGFVAKTLVDYSSHMTLHLNKRAFKCAECQEHFNGVDDLNKHFAENHSEKIQEHKEAIQKIPHGLQQTYHLLKMPLNNISTQEMSSTTSEPKYLKCNMCQFVAKWPAELQKHAVSHSEERPFICMVCGSTYKWKWDLVKHFEKSHSSLQNPYKRREQNTPTSSSKSSTSMPQSSSSSYGGMNNGLYSGALQMLSSTAAALVDKDQFSSKRYADDYHDEMPSRKQRRMSDTELQLLEDTNNNLSRDDYIMAGAVDYHTNRASSEPPKNNESFGENGMQKSTILKEMENMIPSSDESNQSGRDQFIRMKDGMTIKDADGTDILLPYKCRLCEYRARWPSEIQQHMKNHSDEKPYHCPRCSYKSKWKWDVVKHLKRCGGGTIKDVIDTTKLRKLPPPNVTVMPEGDFHEQTPQPFKHLQQQQPERDMQENSMHKRFVYNGFMQTMTENEQNEKIITYECLECPFVGNSPAELKRHSVLHSENKPFSCTVCGYSSRWKCDLKKHMRTYGHENKFLPQMEGMSPMFLQDKFKLSPVHSAEEERQLYKCDQCQYATYKKLSYQAHLKMHGTNIKEETNDKFKCKQCSFKAPDLSSFLQHKKTHSTPSTGLSQHNGPSPQPYHQSSNNKTDDETAPNNEVSNRTLHLKHRRKPSQPVQQFKCSKCPFTSFSKSSIMMHENTHEEEKKEEENNRSQDEDQYSDCKVIDEQEYQFEASEMNQTQEKPISFFGALDLSRTSTPVSSTKQQRPVVSMPQSLFQRTTPSSVYRFPCEWCPARFPNLATVYQHAQKVHPKELKDQESIDPSTPTTGMSLPTRQPVTPSRVPDFENQQVMPPKHSLPQLQAQLQQNPVFSSMFKYRPIEPKPSIASIQTTPSIASMPSTVSALTQSLQQRLNDNRAQNAVAMQLQQQAMARAKKSTSPQKRGRSFQCTKCSFTAPNAVTYLRHIERHGSNCRHTCRFCDYSIDRLNLLYQHMKGTHGDVWRGTPEEKIRLTPSSRGDDKRSWMMQTHDPESLNSSFDGSDYGQEMDLQEQLEESANREMKIYSTMAINGQKPILIIRGMANWRGIPIQLCMINGRKNYKCPSCSYVSSNAANTGNHARQHNCGKKYSCDICNYGADNLKLIHHHKDSIHPPEAIFIEKYENTPFTEYEGSMDENGFPTGNKGPMILPTCTKCPFKCRTVKKLQKHLLLHGSGEKNKCEYCDYHVPTMEELLQHLVVHREPYEPKLESSDEEDSASSAEHKDNQIEQPVLTEEKINNILNKLSNNAGQIRYKCSRCAFTAYRKSSLFTHVELHLKQPHLGDKYVHRMGNEDVCNEQADKYFQTVIIDPRDEKGLDILKTANTSDFSDHDMDEEKEFMDEGEYMDEIETIEGGEFAEEEMVHEEFGGTETPNFGQKSFNEEDSDDSLSEMDPIALQQQMSLNLSGKIDAQKVRYTCTQCPYRCNALRSFKCHIHMHGLNKKYICDYCNWSADRLNLLYQHRKVHLSETGFNNAPEDIVFLNRDFALENNKRSNDLGFNKSVASLEEKILSRMTSKTDDGKKIFICRQCPFSCSNRNSYTYHKSLHKITARYTCSECSFSVDRWNLLSQHMKLHKRDVTQSPSSDVGEYKNYEPTTPEFAPQLYFNSQNSMNDSDISEEDDYSELKCDRCPYSTPSKENLNNHQHQHSKRSENICPYCDFSCQKEEQLVQHLQCHFPSTKIDSETFKSIIEKQGKHNEKHLKPEIPVVKKMKMENGGEPDSTSTGEGQHHSYEQTTETIDQKVKIEKTCTKIYVCQYCEREFEGKSLLLQHEKQHLIGN